MAYSINYNDTSLEPTPITVADATVNTETSIKLSEKTTPIMVKYSMKIFYVY